MSARGSSRSFAGTTGGQVSAAVATHEADTTNVHGITDTSVLETTTGAQTKATAAQTAAVASSLQKASNLSDLASPSTARTSLGLGGAATLAVGTTAGTVAAGDDSRLINDGWDTTTGVVSFNRDVAISALAGPTSSGHLLLAYFTARRAATVSTVTFWSGTTAAGATPTLFRFGVYAIASDGGATLVASTASDLTLAAAASTEYSKALSGSVTFTAGLRYAVGTLVVTGATLPSFQGQTYAGTSASLTYLTRAPRTLGRLTGQTDLPGSYVDASLIAVTARVLTLLT